MSKPKHKWVVIIHDGDERTHCFSTKRAALNYAHREAYYYQCAFSIAKVSGWETVKWRETVEWKAE